MMEFQKAYEAKILITGKDVDILVVKEILRSERIPYTIEVDPVSCLRLGRGMVNPGNGWLVIFPNLSEVASRWSGIYSILEKRGLLLC